MSHTLSPSSKERDGVARVAAVWAIARSTFYAIEARELQPAGPPAKPVLFFILADGPPRCRCRSSCPCRLGLLGIVSRTALAFIRREVARQENS